MSLVIAMLGKVFSRVNFCASFAGRFFVGQNLAYGYANWKETIKAWYDEVNDFTYGQPPSPGKKVLHYTQVYNLLFDK